MICLQIHYCVAQALRKTYPKDEYKHFRKIPIQFASYEERSPCLRWLRGWRHQQEPCLLVRRLKTSSRNLLAHIEVKKKVRFASHFSRGIS
jgi:adenylosuccinate synthase